MSCRLIPGHVLDQLRLLPDASVHCVVTSPPYWGLRDYQIPKQVWGGDPQHEHVFGPELVIRKCGHIGKYRWAHGVNGRGEAQPAQPRGGWERREFPQGCFCECGAWVGALGLEPTPELYVEHIVAVFRDVRRVLRADGTLWLNMGDSYANDTKWGGTSGGLNYAGALGGYAGQRVRRPKDRDPKRGPRADNAIYGGCVPTGVLKSKDLVGMPWRVAFALQADGWYLRMDNIWRKLNPMPESVKDRPTKAHEYMFLLSKSQRYYYDYVAISEPCGPDTRARYARGRSDNHKWADGGPGNQTIATNKQGSLFVRVDKEGRNSRLHVSRDAQHPHEVEGKQRKVPAGWHQGTRGEQAAPRDRRGSGNKERKLADGTNTHLGRNVPYSYADHLRAPGVNPKCAEPGSGIKQNSSFSAAVKDLVPFRNKRSVWSISTKPYKGAHFATFPPKLVEPCILAGCPEGGTVLDPFGGAGTVGLVAEQHGRNSILIELNPKYCEMAAKRVGIHEVAEAEAELRGPEMVVA